jgi:ActR/RegA family two-component response regulator
MSSSEFDRNTSGQTAYYVLIDRNGPLAEFETWEDAYQCMSTRQIQGGSIVRCDGPIGGRPISRGQTGSTQEQPGLQVIKKVLVISEDVPTLLAMAQVVKVAGHGVSIVRSAAEAVQTIGLERPDLVIVDVDGTAEHGWDGVHVVEWLGCHYPEHHAKYIVVSSGDPERFKPRTTGVGACGFVGKPVAKELLLAEIEHAIGGPPPMEGSESKARPWNLWWEHVSMTQPPPMERSEPNARPQES